MNRAALPIIVLACILLAGCLEGNGCPEQEDSVLCGLCESSNRCYYCDAGQTCSGDVCGNYQCITPRVETTLFRFVGGQLAPENTPATLSNGQIGFSYDAWFVIVLEDGTEAAEGYTYSLEDPENAPLPSGLTLAEDGHLTGLPASQGDYTFTVCATSPDGVKSCRETTMHVGMPQVPSASPTPSATPTTGPIGIFDGSWTGIATLYMRGPEGSFPAGCHMKENYTFNIWHISGENQFSGNVEATVLEVVGCWPEVSALVGQTETVQMGSKQVNGQSARFSAGQTDYAFTVSGDNMIVDLETCQSPDPRCTCDSPDPRCPAEEMLPGQWTDVHQETINWWDAGFTATRTGLNYYYTTPNP